MAEQNIKLIGYKELENGIAGIIKFLNNPSKAFAEAKMIMFQDVMDHFDKEEGPAFPWTKLSKLTLIMRRKKGKGALKLRDSGDMYDAITGFHSRTGAGVGVKKKYAVKQQEGGTTEHGHEIPARPFIWLSNKAQRRIAERFTLHLKESLG